MTVSDGPPIDWGQDEAPAGPLVPPHDLDAEGAVLAAVLLDRRALDATGGLTPEDFYAERHRRIFEAALALHTEGQPIDAVTIAQRLKAAGRLDQVGGMAYLAEVLSSSPALANIGAHARIVRDKARLRAIIEAAHKIVAEGYVAADATAFADAAAQRIVDLAGQKTDGAFTPYARVAKAVLTKAAGRMQGKEAPPGVSTGYPALDRLVLGMMPGRLYVVAARPAVGKSTLAGNIAYRVAARPGDDAAVVSLEMGNEENALRYLAAEALVDGNDIERGQIGPYVGRLSEAATRAANVRLWLNDDSTMTIAKLRRLVRGLKLEVERAGRTLRLLVVDYLQLFGAEAGRKNGSREQDVAAVSRGLKVLAKEFSLAVIAVSQLNRDVEKGAETRRPRKSDLRESGAIEQDADFIIFLQPTGQETPDGYQDVEVIVDKARVGKPGVVKTKFRKPFTRFDELEEDA